VSRITAYVSVAAGSRIGCLCALSASLRNSKPFRASIASATGGGRREGAIWRDARSLGGKSRCLPQRAYIGPHILQIARSVRNE
jgi:hypothetical protein